MIDAGIHYFPGQGYRPAIYLNDYIGPRLDCPLIVPAPDADVAMIGKFDPFAHIPTSESYTWGTWIPASPAPQITAASLAGPVATPVYGNPQPSPWWPTDPWSPDYPCHCVEVPPINPPLPEPTPVPLPASAGLLLAGMALLWLWGRK